ncbi:hypothetical protein DFH06DRAFT_1357957 [Mycena polygramma]|nr:hypothetical protein DFH06DRAFT_1357957 [Mycena polygramma]
MATGHSDGFEFESASISRSTPSCIIRRLLVAKFHVQSPQLATKSMHQATPNGESEPGLRLKAEKLFRYKVDALLMSYAALSYTLKLNLLGNELTWMGTLFSIGYVMGTIPSQILLTKIRPSIVLPTIEILWGVLVICMAAANSVNSIYALRFCIGFLEAASYPGLIAVLASWYVPSELGKRRVNICVEKWIVILKLQPQRGHFPVGICDGW